MEVAVSAASWVVRKALAPVADGFLEAWAASAGLGPNINALKLQLLYAQAMLNNTRGRVVDNPDLNELLHKLRELAYDADDVLDELEYFRIQDLLEGTYHAAADVDSAGGCVNGLVHNALHTARAVASKLKLSGSRDDPGEEDGDAKQKYSSCVCSCGRRRAVSSSSPPLPTNQKDETVGHGCMPNVTTTARNTAHAVGKRLPYCFSPSLDDDSRCGMSGDLGMLHDSDISGDGHRFHCGACRSTKEQQRKGVKEIPRLEFNRVEISRKMKDIVEQLKPICAMVSTILNLELLGSNHSATKDTAINRPKTTQGIIEPKLFGRDIQLKGIVARITNRPLKKDAAGHGEYPEKKLIVLPVVGPGGIGKTTLVQHVYQEVKSNFHVSIWICVSLNFSANRLAQEIVKKIPEANGESKSASEEEIIEQRLKYKRFLLVLDDMWTCHEDEWKKLVAPLSKGEEQGNVVIVTTRIPEVAKMVMTDDYLMELESLGDKDFMSFFEECVFGHKKSWEDHPELLGIGNKIVNNLKGLPLAAKTVGRLLRNQLTLEHWTRVLESKEWELQTGDNDIMPALKLSYDYLPFHLQQCFPYCALFPKDYEFGSHELIHMWTGLDIFHSLDQNKRIEDVGQSYLDDLVNNSFLKRNVRDDGHPYYVVHDLLHELAAKVSSYECLSISSSNLRSIKTPPSVRHLSIIIDDKDVEDRVGFERCKKGLNALKKRLVIKNLRTLLLFGKYHHCFVKTLGELFREAKSLRIILCEASYSVEDLLPNFSNLVHLRYLRIKRGFDLTVSVPRTISRLYLLKILDVQQFDIASTLPRDMSNLINLHHFFVPDDSLHSDIFEVGRQKYLKELRRFEVKKENKGFELKQLGELQELHVLGIYNLENVEVKEADRANLIQKEHLQELVLDWDLKRTVQSMQEGNVLECLKPHGNLKKLCIKGHGGAKCPTWLGMNLSVQNLEYLRLDHVSWEKLPPLGGSWMLNQSIQNFRSQSFMNLKRLELANIQNLEKWVRNSTSRLFSHLEALVIEGCPELLELPFSYPRHQLAEQVKNMSWFPSLLELEVKDCPKLLDVPPIPWTCATCFAEIGGVGSGFKQLVYSNAFESACSLKIEGKDAVDTPFWDVLAFHNLIQVTKLEMDKCPPLQLDHLQMLSSLKELLIWNSRHETWIVEGECQVKYKFPVERISMDGCGTSGKELTQFLSYFPKLLNLKIRHCQKVTGLGAVEQQTRATATSSASSSANEVEATKGEEEIAASNAEGLLLLPRQLQELEIVQCTKVSLHHNEKETRGTGGLQYLRSLQSLIIRDCPEFFSFYASSSSSYFPFPSSLQKLHLSGVGSMEILLPLSNLVISLTDLGVYGCQDLKVQGLQPLLTQGHITKLSVQKTPNFFVSPEPSRLHEQQFPPCSSILQYLDIDDYGVLDAPIFSLLSTSITVLVIKADNEAERFTKEQEDALQVLTSLQDLYFQGCRKLRFLPAGMHRLTNLKLLEIRSCPAIRSLSMDGLPSSLQKLYIKKCKAIRSLTKDGSPSMQELRVRSCPPSQSLPKEGLLSSLQILHIEYCPSLRSLAKDGLPSSLQQLYISNSPALRSLPLLPSSLRDLDVCSSKSDELRKQCRKLKGTIPIVKA